MSSAILDLLKNRKWSLAFTLLAGIIVYNTYRLVTLGFGVVEFFLWRWGRKDLKKLKQKKEKKLNVRAWGVFIS